MGIRRVQTLALVVIGAATVLLLYSGTACARFRFQGDLSGDWEFNNNINSSSTGKISDEIWTVTPTATLTEFTPAHSLAASFSFSTRRYVKTVLDDRDTYTGGLTGHYNLSPRTFVDFYETFSYTPKVTTETQNFAPTFTDAGIVTSLVTHNVASQLVDNTAGGTITHQLTRLLKVSLTGKIDMREFTSTQFTDSSDKYLQGMFDYTPTKRDRFNASLSHHFYAYGNNLTDTTTDVASGTWDRDWSKRFTRRFKLSYTDDSTKTFATDTQPSYRVGSKSIEASGGGTYDIDRSTQLIFLAGANFSRRTGHLPPSQTTSESQKHTVSPVYDTTLTRHFAHSSLSLNLRQTFNAGYQSGFDTMYQGASYSYEFTPDLTLNLNVSRSHSKTTGSNTTGTNSIDTTTLNYYVIMNYKIDRKTFFSVSWADVDQKSKGGGIGGNIKQQVWTFSLDLLDLNHRRP